MRSVIRRVRMVAMAVVLAGGSVLAAAKPSHALECRPCEGCAEWWEAYTLAQNDCTVQYPGTCAEPFYCQYCEHVPGGEWHLEVWFYCNDPYPNPECPQPEICG